MTAPHSKTVGTTLIVASRRADRKAIFEALESLDVEAIYTAKNPPEAFEFLGQVPISLLIVDLALDGADVTRMLKAHANGGGAGRVIGLMPSGEGRWNWEALPAGVIDCVRSPVERAEFLFRLMRAQAPRPAESPAAGGGEVLFDSGEDQRLLSDPRRGDILAVNRAFLVHSGGASEDWIGQPLDSIGLNLTPAERRAHNRRLARDGVVRFHCLRQGKAGPDLTVEVTQTLGMHAGSLVYLTVIRDVSAETRLRRRLAALGRFLPDPETGPPVAALADLIAESLDLDYFLVTAADPEHGEALKVLAAFSRGDFGPPPTDPATHLPYRKLLAGEAVLAARDARAKIGADPFLDDHGIASYIALPLTIDRRPAGAVIAARREPIVDPDSALEVLKAAALIFAQEHEVRSLRSTTEAVGLHDSLTRLPNRLLFDDRLIHALKEARRTGEMFALLFIDLDRFKNINDTLGHDVGDQVLIGIGQRLQRAVRGSDTVARYAGDEFTVLLRHIVQKEDVLRISQKINKLLAQPLRPSDELELQVTASIGVSFYPDDGSEPSKLLKNADIAMYGAKGLGRNTAQFYVDQPQESQQQKLLLESKLRQAEANNELRVFFQPQVDVANEDIVGMEALVRWEHPELGLISPGFFIPLAEETGLIVPIGEWVLRRACKMTRQWQQRFDLGLTLGVNLSPLQLRQPDLLELVERVLNDTGLHPNFLDLEVTESISIKTIPGLTEKLEGLRELGCRISIDDFGTGQSSLDYLKRFPADRIKIDQSFVRNIGVDPDDEAIVKATIGMAHQLKLQVVAEGVEEEDHLEFLRAAGCDEMQGFLFCRPLPADSFSTLLMEREALTTGAKTT